MNINKASSMPVMEFLAALSFIKDLAEVEKSKLKQRTR